MKRPYLLFPICAVLGACGSASDSALPGDSSDSSPFAGIAPEDVLRLTGTEPFWGARIEGEVLTYSTLEDSEGTAIAVARFAGRGGVSFSGTLDGLPFDAMVTAGACSDGMSDRIYPFNATVQVGSEQRIGCAWREGLDALGEP